MARDALDLPDPLERIHRRINRFGGSAPKKPKKESAFPPLAPEEEAGALAKIGHGARGLATYLGETLDKPGRAVRGLLAGRPEELANLVPFSDTMGITHPEKSVTGRQLLEKAGVLGKNKPGFDTGDVAGFATDVALDPLTYLTLGASAVGKAGKVAKMAGMLPKTRGARVAETMADVVGRANPGQISKLENAAGGAAELTKHVQSGEKLGGLAKFGTKVVHVPHEDRIAQALDRAAEKVRYAPGIRHAAAVFSYPSRGVHTKEAQLARQAMTEAEPAIRAEANRAARTFAEMVEKAGLPKGKENEILDPLVEGLPMAPHHAATLSPQQVKAAEDAADFARAYKDTLRQKLVSEGWNLPEITDELHVEHFPRYLTGTSATKKSWADRIFRIGMDSKLGRQEFLKKIPRGREAINQMASDPFLAGANRLAPDDAAAASYIRQKHGVTGPGQAEQLAKFMHKHATGKPMFGDPVRDFAHYARQGTDTLHAVKGVKDFLLKHQEPMQPGLVQTNDILKRLGFDVTGPSQHGVPAEIAGDAERFIKGMQVGDELKPWVSAVDWFTQKFKGGVTFPWPSFHVRNRTTGAWQQFVGGATDPAYGPLNPWRYVQPWIDAESLVSGRAVKGADAIPGIARPGITADQATRQLAREAFDHDILTHTLAQDVAGLQSKHPDVFSSVIAQIPGREPKPFARTLARTAKEAASAPQPTTAASKVGKVAAAPVRGALAAGKEANNLVEAGNRLSMYIAFRKQGMAPEVAAARTKLLNGDYARMTNTEKRIMARWIPFYKYTKLMIPVAIKDLAERPGGPTAIAMKAGAQGRQRAGFLPEYLGGGLAIPWGQETPEGRQRYLTQIDLPHEQLNLAEVGPGGIRKTGLNLLGMMNPLAKAPLELATGKSFFQDRDLRELDPRVGRLLAQAGVLKHPKQFPQLAEHGIMNSPLSRIVSTAGTIADARKNIPTKMANLGTGLRFSDIDVARQSEIGARNLVQELLRSEPGVQAYTDLYATDPEALSPQGQMMMRLVRTMQQRAQKAKRAEAKKMLAAR